MRVLLAESRLVRSIYHAEDFRLADAKYEATWSFLSVSTTTGLCAIALPATVVDREAKCCWFSTATPTDVDSQSNSATALRLNLPQMSESGNCCLDGGVLYANT